MFYCWEYSEIEREYWKLYPYERINSKIHRHTNTNTRKHKSKSGGNTHQKKTFHLFYRIESIDICFIYTEECSAYCLGNFSTSTWIQQKKNKKWRMFGWHFNKNYDCEIWKERNSLRYILESFGALTIHSWCWFDRFFQISLNILYDDNEK